MCDEAHAESGDVEAALVGAGFPASYARDTAFYCKSFNSENEARAYRLAHSDTFLDDLDWDTARAHWTARADGRGRPSMDELKQLAGHLRRP
jgi:hypothetical protein